MTRRALLRFSALAALLLAIYLGRSHGPAELVAGPDTAAATQPVLAAGEVARPAVGFRSDRDLIEHHAKHGAEFGGIGVDEYLRRAQTLRDRPAGGAVLEAIRADGVITRFDRATGDFLAADPDGTIRTFFRPNAGEAYFQRQAQRESESR